MMSTAVVYLSAFNAGLDAVPFTRKRDIDACQCAASWPAVVVSYDLPTVELMLNGR